MPLVQPMPVPRFQFFDPNGLPVANGFLYTYGAGTNTPLATYNDHTGSIGALNPNPVQLDSGGYADVWLTASSYKLVLTDANNVQIWSIDGVPGLGSLISVGDLPPLFTSVFAAGGLSFVLDDAAPHTLFGRFAGTTGAPSFGAIGSDKQVTFNDAGEMVGSNLFQWDDALQQLGIGPSGLRLSSNPAPGPLITFGSATDPSILFATSWAFINENTRETSFGQRQEPADLVINNGGLVGVFSFGRSSHAGTLILNDGSSVAGVLAGARIIMGSIPTPETFISAETGSIFLTTNGGAGTTLWVKESSPTATTGWVGK